MMYELGTTSAFDDERMGAASPWMVLVLTVGAAAAVAAMARAMRPLIVDDKEGGEVESTSRLLNKRTNESKTMW